jgi:hypothetical protein
MFKITVHETGYQLHKFVAGKYTSLCKVSCLDKMLAYNEKFLDKHIDPQEMRTAFEWIKDTNHNTLEFGYRGLFTVSFYDEAVGD